MAYELVVMGASWGGLHALQVVLGGLPKSFHLPVAIVQHRGGNSPTGLDMMLQQYCALPVQEVEDKIAIAPGKVYLAPVGYHVLVEPGSFALTTEAPVLFARPSIDVLFESAADAYGGRVIGVVLTGASQDGTRGLAKIKASGGLAIVEDPATAERGKMPASAIAGTKVDRILPLKQIAPYLASLSLPT